MDCYNCGELGHLAHQCTKPKKDKYKNKYKTRKMTQVMKKKMKKKKNKPYKKRDGKKRDFHKKKKSGKAYIIGDWLTDIDSSSGSPMMRVTMRRWPPLLLILHPHRHHRYHPLHTYALWPRVNAR